MDKKTKSIVKAEVKEIQQKMCLDARQYVVAELRNKRKKKDIRKEVKRMVFAGQIDKSCAKKIDKELDKLD